MLERVLTFLRELPSGDAKSRPREDDPRIAAAALLYHVMNADGVRHDVEWDRVKALLGDEYDLGGDELDQLVSAGQSADAEAIDLYAFTSVLKRHLDEQQRIRFIRMMWDVVYADGEVHELEDNTLWRVAELIGVASRDRIAQRKEAARDVPAVKGTPHEE